MLLIQMGMIRKLNRQLSKMICFIKDHFCILKAHPLILLFSGSTVTLRYQNSL